MGLNSGRLHDAATNGEMTAVEEQLSAIANIKSAVTIVVGTYGDYTTLSAALAAITDASAAKQYHIIVSGNIAETAGITAKSYVHVSGIAAASVTVTMTDATYGFTFDDIVCSTWSNLRLYRAGAVTESYAFAAYISGTAARSCQIINCHIENITTLGASVDHRVGLWVTETADPLIQGCTIIAADGANYGMGLIVHGSATGLYRDCTIYGGQDSANCWGIYAINNASPTFVNCVAYGGDGGLQCYGGCSREGSSPYFYNCVFHGGDGGTACNGFYSSEGSAPIFHNCVFVGGGGGANCRGIDITDSSSPHLLAITTMPPIESLSFTLTETTTIVLNTTQPHQINAISFQVITAAAGQTVKIGITEGGEEIATAQSIATTGFKTVTFGASARNVLAANATLYITFSGGGLVLLRPSIFISNSGCYGINIDSSNTVLVDNSTIIANCASYAVVVSAAAVTANKLRFTNCHVETRVKNVSSLQSFACSAAYNDAPVYYCTIITGTLNLTAKAATSTNGTNIVP